MKHLAVIAACCVTFCYAVTILEEAEKLGAKTLVKLIKDAYLTETLSGPGKT